MHGPATEKVDMCNQSSWKVQACTHTYSKAASDCFHSPASLKHRPSRLAWPGRWLLLLLLLLLQLVQLRSLLCGRTQCSQLSV